MSRGLSLGLACIAGCIGLVFPFMFANRPTALNQTILLLMMAGISGAFVHAVGLRVEKRWLRCLTRPAFTWPTITVSAAALFWLRN